MQVISQVFSMPSFYVLLIISSITILVWQKFFRKKKKGIKPSSSFVFLLIISIFIFALAIYYQIHEQLELQKTRVEQFDKEHNLKNRK